VRIVIGEIRYINLYICTYLQLWVYENECNMGKISFSFDLGRSFVSISLKLNRVASSMENWRGITFGLNRLSRGGESRVIQVAEFQEN